jgi:Domain of unknown function (DUF5615)
LRVLLDENVDRRLKRTFDEQHEVSTVPARGWAGMKNGELLEEAGKEFDVLLTTDRGIPHQQNLLRFDLAVIGRAGCYAFDSLGVTYLIALLLEGRYDRVRIK